MIKQIINENPAHAGANYALGSILLKQQDAAGIQHLELAMQHDATTNAEACSLISDFYRQQGQNYEADAYYARAERHYEKLHQQFTPSKDDRFEPHGLDDQQLQNLQKELAAVRGLGIAYLARKIVEGAEPIYVMGVIATYTWREGRSEKDSAALIDELVSKTHLSGPTIFVSLEGELAFLQRKLSEIPGSEVFVSEFLEPEVRV